MLASLYARVVTKEMQIEQREFVADGRVSLNGGKSFDASKRGWLRKEGGRVKTLHRRYALIVSL